MGAVGEWYIWWGVLYGGVGWTPQQRLQNSRISDPFIAWNFTKKKFSYVKVVGGYSFKDWILYLPLFVYLFHFWSIQSSFSWARNQLPQTSPHTPNNFPEFFLSYLSIHRLVLSQRYGLSVSYLSSVIEQAILPGLKSAAYNHTCFSHQTAPAMLYHFLRSSSKKTVSRVSLTILHRFSATSSSGLCY